MPFRQREPKPSTTAASIVESLTNRYGEVSPVAVARDVVIRKCKTGPNTHNSEMALAVAEQLTEYVGAVEDANVHFGHDFLRDVAEAIKRAEAK
jgi:hypothetical protein